MKATSLFLLLALSSLAPAAVGQSHIAHMKSGNEFLLACESSLDIKTSDPNDYAGLECLAWIRGVWSGLIAANAWPGEKPFMDVPPDVTTGQVMRIAIKSMKDHPDSLDTDPALLVMAALVQAYPAKKY
jgi:hypothetical protein